MEPWRKVWQEGIAPMVSLQMLESLAEALDQDDPRLVTGQTCLPLPTLDNTDRPAAGVCPIGWLGWCQGLGTVGDVVDFFAAFCCELDERLGGEASLDFVRWVDSSPRDVVRAELLAEIKALLAEEEPCLSS